MTPDTIHRLAQEIRHWRALLTSEEKWIRTQSHSAAKIELFQRITFWRGVLSEAERRISVGDTRESAGVAQGQRQG